MKEHPMTHNPPGGGVNISDPRVQNQQMRWHVLHNLIEDNGYTKIAEVGCQEGRTGWFLLENSSSSALDLTCVDPYLVYDGYGYVEPFDMSEAETQARTYLSKFIEEGRCHFVKKFSVDAVDEYEDDYFDLVFIDANHTYEFVKEDIDAWYPKVGKGGILAGHDWCEGFPGVQQAVEEYFTPLKKAISLSHNSVWYVKK